MTRNLQATLVGLIDRGAQFLASDVLVRLEGGHTTICPIGHRLTCILRPGELVHLEIWIIAGAFQIRADDIQMWSRKHARLDGLPESQVRVRIDTACSARRSDAIRKIQSR